MEELGLREQRTQVPARRFSLKRFLRAPERQDDEDDDRDDDKIDDGNVKDDDKDDDRDVSLTR